MLEIGFLIFLIRFQLQFFTGSWDFFLLFRFFLFFCGAIKRLYFSEHFISFWNASFMKIDFDFFLSMPNLMKPHWGNFCVFYYYFWLDDEEKLGSNFIWFWVKIFVDWKPHAVFSLWCRKFADVQVIYGLLLIASRAWTKFEKTIKF